jgi:hypothetical protein
MVAGLPKVSSGKSPIPLGYGCSSGRVSNTDLLAGKQRLAGAIIAFPLSSRVFLWAHLLFCPQVFAQRMGSG